MTTEVSAFRWVPPFAQGYVRDLRVRWALEEAGIPYEATLVDRTTLSSPGYREWQPFGQVPAFRDDNVEMFESGAIVLHIAEQSDALCPRDPSGRARMMSWVIAALNSVEPHVETYAWLDVIHVGEPWVEERRPHLHAMLKGRLEALATWLGDKPYLVDGRFTAADLIMTTVLRELVGCGILAEYPTLDAYRKRCESRPAFARAMEAQMQPFRENAPA